MIARTEGVAYRVEILQPTGWTLAWTCFGPASAALMEAQLKANTGKDVRVLKVLCSSKGHW